MPRKYTRRSVAATDPLDKTVQQVEQEMTAGLPDKEIPIIGQPHTPKDVEEQVFGPEWYVRVIELDLPYAKDVHTVSLTCSKGSYTKTFLANTETILRDSAIKMLTNDTVVVNRRSISMGSAMYGKKEVAERLNPGYSYEEDAQGNAYLVKRSPRFHVERIKPVKEMLVAHAV